MFSPLLTQFTDQLIIIGLLWSIYTQNLPSFSLFFSLNGSFSKIFNLNFPELFFYSTYQHAAHKET